VRPLVSDERLSRRLATGEAAAFDELYRRYSHRLSAYASGLLGDRAAGEDVAQVALLNAYQALRKGQEPDKVRPWLFRIAHNEAVDMLARRRELLDGLDLENRPAPEDATETRGALLDALAKLPDRQRRAYVLREVHGLRVAEIAAELSLAVPQVEQALFAARNRLAEELVFGDLSCDSARRLAEGPLAGIERKALRHHFRTCDRCRAAGVGVAPGLGFDWLRGRLADLLVGGAAPAAAKVGAVVAASVATGVTVGPTVLRHEPHFAGVTAASAASPTVARQPRAAAAATTRLTAREPVALSTVAAPALEHKQLRPGEHEPTRAQHGEPAAFHDSRDREHTTTTISTPEDNHRQSGDGGENHAIAITIATTAHSSSKRGESDRPEKEHPERDHPSSSPEPTTTTETTQEASPPPPTTSSERDSGIVLPVLAQVTATTTPRPRGD
jgi:RNA polymerase sigma factor (sigma-70 family)